MKKWVVVVGLFGIFLALVAAVNIFSIFSLIDGGTPPAFWVMVGLNVAAIGSYVLVVANLHADHKEFLRIFVTQVHVDGVMDCLRHQMKDAYDLEQVAQGKGLQVNRFGVAIKKDQRERITRAAELALSNGFVASDRVPLF